MRFDDLLKHFGGLRETHFAIGRWVANGTVPEIPPDWDWEEMMMNYCSSSFCTVFLLAEILNEIRKKDR